MHHPRGLGPPPLRRVSGGPQRGPSEPPCGLRPRANPMKLPDRRIPDNRKQYHTQKMTPPPNSPAILKPALQVQERARVQDNTTRRTAAHHILPLNRRAPTHYLNCLPPKRGPANFPCQIRKLTISSTDLGGSLMPATGLLHLKRGDRTAGCIPGKGGRGPRNLGPARHPTFLSTLIPFLKKKLLLQAHALTTCP